MNTSIKTLAAVALLGALALSAAPSYAADPDQMSVKVMTRDLDLSSDAGAKALVARIHSAARTICGIEPEHAQFGPHRQYDRCVKDIVNRAVASINNPAVTAANGQAPQPFQVSSLSH